MLELLEDIKSKISEEIIQPYLDKISQCETLEDLQTVSKSTVK